jgi:hypothetical protein
MDTIVVVDGQTFIVPNEKVLELKSWLESNSVSRESNNQQTFGFDGQNLLNE